MRPIRIFAFLGSFTVASVGFAAPSLSDTVGRYSELKLAGAQQVANVTFTTGHLTITMPSGIAAAVNGRDGAPVGVYYRGAGTFAYESAYRDEFPVVRYNAKNNDVAVKSAPDKLRIEDRFEDVLILGARPDATGASTPAPEPAFAQHTQLFGREETAPAGHLFALQALDAPDGRVVRVQINGSKPFVYVYDEVASHSESLATLRKPGAPSVQFKRSLFTTRLSSQPVGRKAREEAAPRVMLTDVDVALVASEKDDAAMTVVETLVPLKRAANAIRFDLYSLYYTDADRAPREYKVQSITDESARPLSFSHAGDELIVTLAKPAPAGQPLKLKFEIAGNFLYRPGGDNYWELGVEPWFPQTEWNEESFTFHALVKVKKPFIPFSPGTTLRREVEGDYNVVETKIEQAIQFPAILAGKYHASEETRNGVTVRVATYAIKNAAAVKKLTNLAFAAIDYYPKFLGPFPFNEINIIEKNDFGYGQAPPATVFITKEAFSPRDEEAGDYVEGVNRRFAHEIAHQYWAHAVKMGSREEQWITESFAEYSAALFMKAAKNPNEYERALVEWRTGAREVGDLAPIPLANRLSNPGFPELAGVKRFQLLYGKGPYLLAAIHKEIGDQAFLTFLKSYQKSFRWKFGTTQDVIGLLGVITKKDYAPFFEQYYYGTALPEIKR